MREALTRLNAPSKDFPQGRKTPCADRPVPYTDVRQSYEDARELCGRDTDHECPVLKYCEPLGYTESVYADDMVYGGLTWRRGIPVVSETGPRPKRAGTKQEPHLKGSNYA